LKQTYYSYSRTHNIQNSLYSLLVFLRSTLLLNRNKLLVKNFLFFISLHFPQYVYWPLPYSCFGSYLCFMWFHL